MSCVQKIFDSEWNAMADSRGTRPDTRLLKSRVGGQGPFFRSPDHLGKSSEVKEIKS